jgi:uncharacterized protein YjbI with pentapeptide repeats
MAPEGTRVIPEHQWSEVERWAWEEIRAGRTADFSKQEGEFDPNEPEGWGDKRRLSADFLRGIVFREPHKSATPVEGVRITGALFREPVDLADGRTDHQLGLARCRFENSVNLAGLRVERLSFEGSAFLEEGADLLSLNLLGTKVAGQVAMDGATVTGQLLMAGLKVGGNLCMGIGAKFRDVDLSAAKVDGELRLSHANVAGRLNMEGLEVGRGLYLNGATVGELLMNSLQVGGILNMGGAKFRDVDLTAAKIGGQLTIRGATVASRLCMNSLEVRESLFMHLGAKFSDVDLTGAKIHGQLGMADVTVDGRLHMDSLDVGESLYIRDGAKLWDVDLTAAKIHDSFLMDGATVRGWLMMNRLAVTQNLMIRDAVIEGKVSIVLASIGFNFDLTRAEFIEMDLSSTRIEGELRLDVDSPLTPKWRKLARLILRDAHAGILRDNWEGNTNAWPDQLQLDGFTYDRLGRSEYGSSRGMMDRDIGWYIDKPHGWLERSRSHSPQPYTQLAKVFRAAGEPAKADRILYASRERARRSAKSWRWLGLSLLKITIGYGLGARYFWALAWVIGATAVGAILLLFTGQPPDGLAAKAAYSLDQLLPIVEFEKSFGELALQGLVKYYFYAIKLVGWVLTSFLIAGLAGLTQE